MVIGLVLTMAITIVMVRSEASKRTTTSVNDINQTAAYVTYVMDRHLRSAGSGFAQRWSEAFGCVLNASKGGVAVLPRGAAIASPFGNAVLNPRLAPVIVQADAANVAGGEIRGDLITVMTGTAPTSGSPLLVATSTVTGTGTSGNCRLRNPGLPDGDVVCCR